VSIEYDQYLVEHKSAVIKAWNWMQDHLLFEIEPWFREKYNDVLFDPFDIYEISENIARHDESKTNPDEYHAYDAYFYGNNKSFAVVNDFNRAFLYHLHRNPHHWQYWVLTPDSKGEGEKLIEIPIPYIFEMICDWWSFSWRKGDLYEIFNWWDQRKDYIRMHKRSREAVEKILQSIKEILDAEKVPEEIAHTDIPEKEEEKKFGLPDLKKYPMPDPDHVKSAIRFFNYVDPKHEKELAEAILERMKEYNMSFEDFGVGDENRFKKYIPKNILDKENDDHGNDRSK